MANKGIGDDARSMVDIWKMYCADYIKEDNYMDCYICGDEEIVEKNQFSCCHWSLKKTQAGVLVFGGESNKEGVCGFGACTWSCQ